MTSILQLLNKCTLKVFFFVKKNNFEIEQSLEGNDYFLYEFKTEVLYEQNDSRYLNNFLQIFSASYTKRPFSILSQLISSN